MQRRLLALPLTALFLAACSQVAPGPSPDTSLNVSAAPTFTYVKSLKDGLDSPRGVAVKSDGTVYVTSNAPYGDKLVAINTSGSTKTIATYGSGEGQMSTPYGVALDAEGWLFVAEFYGNRIQAFENDKFIGVFSKDNYFTDVAFSPDGAVYATSYNTVYKYKSKYSGTPITSWKGADSTLGQLSSAYGIAVDGSDVYVTDDSRDAVYVFDKNGNTQAVWQKTDGTNVLNGPKGIAVSGEYVYVADTNNDQIVVFDKQGGFVTKFGSSGTGNNQFEFPWGLDVFADQLYVSDSIAGAVKVYDLVAKEQPEPEPDPETYTIDFNTAPANSILYSVALDQGISYEGDSRIRNSDKVLVTGYRYLKDKKLSGQQGKAITDGTGKVLTVVKPGTNTPNADGGILRLKPPVSYSELVLKSLTVEGVTKAGASIRIMRNGEVEDVDPGLVIPIMPNDGSSQTLTFKDLTNVSVIRVSVNSAFSVDDVVFEVPAPIEVNPCKSAASTRC